MSNEQLDRELSLRGIIWTGAGISLIVIFAVVAMWWFSNVLKNRLVSQDPPEPLLFEARVQAPPPEPRLQTDPEQDMADLRVMENELLTGYAWVDQEAGTVRIPIENALELAAQNGLPQFSDPIEGEEATVAAIEETSQ